MQLETMQVGAMYRIGWTADARILRGLPVIFRGIVQDRLTALGGPSAIVETLEGTRYRVRAWLLIPV